MDTFFPVPDVVKVLPGSVLFRDHRGRYHWQIVIGQGKQDPSYLGMNALLPTEKAFAFETKRMAREYYLGKVGDKFHTILRAARNGKSLTYRAPMDRFATVFRGSATLHPFDNVSPTYKVVGDRIKFFPAKEEADPFFADYQHTDRMGVANA